MRIRNCLIPFFLSLFSTTVFAQDSTITRLLSADEARAWTAVGRLNIAGKGTCTGALISPTQVLTAAHCVFDKTTGRMIEPRAINFLAGWRKGYAMAHRLGNKIVVPEKFSEQKYNGEATRASIAYDIAVIELDRRIDASAATPFEILRQPERGDELTVVSYSRGVNEVQTLETGCKVLARDSKIIVSDCIADFGASGSPIFTYDDGVPKIASVMAAMGTRGESKVSFGVALSHRLEEMVDRLESGNLLFNSKRVGEKSLAEQLGRE